jgi:hypothetical protein|tara:strand:- start:11785 stop:13905 length:2121 start_codon:yes stop_codon:yes gene_type:complete
MANGQETATDLEVYRNLLDTPDEFEDGFNLTTVVGIFFCGLIMMPGGIYLGLMTGGNMGSAASWVTLILFMEIARRSLKPMKKQNLSILLHAAGVMMVTQLFVPGGPMGWLVFRAYLVTSETARDAGMMESFPSWFAPPPGSPALLERSFFHEDWLIPIAIVGFVMVISFIKRYTLGYFFFRLTSDVENLPFPLAAIGAQGTLALAEIDEKVEERGAERGAGQGEDDQADQGEHRQSNRWRIFALGAVIGIGFGILQVGVPTITGLFLSKPFYLIPQPFIDTTVLSEGALPATPTGLVLDLGMVFVGFVLPFWVVIGTFAAILATMIVNPILHRVGILHTWQPGMDTINTTFANNIDFWLSFGIGAGFAIALVCIYAACKDVIMKLRMAREARTESAEQEDLWETPAGRGDYPLWIAFAAYSVTAGLLVLLCYYLIAGTTFASPTRILFFLIFFAFLYIPFLSYVNARLLGISGQTVEIPYIKELGFLVSGAKGLEIWLAPVPMENYGNMAQSYRTNELLGVRFWSLIKTDLVALPVMFVLSLMFWSFIWHSDAIPSDAFPTAQVNWELMAKNTVLVYTSTFVQPGEDPDEVRIQDSEFMKAIHPEVIGGSFVAILAIYGGLSLFALPVTFLYGVIRGFGGLPHYMVLEVVGAFLGRYYYQKKYGSINFLRDAPALLAGYFTGVGLISMATIAMRFIQAAVSADPF